MKWVYVIFQSHCISDGSQGRNLEAQTEIEAVEGLSLLTGSAYVLLQPRSICSGLALPRVSQTLSHQSVSNQMPRRLAYRQSDVDFFSNQVLFSQRTLVLYQVENKGKTKTKQGNKQDSCPTSWCPCSFQKDRDKGRMFYSNSSLTLMADREASTKSLEFPEWLVHTECLLLFTLSVFLLCVGVNC